MMTRHLRLTLRCLGLFLIFAIPEPVISNLLGALLIAYSLLPSSRDLGKALDCGCDYHRYGWHKVVDLFALPLWEAHHQPVLSPVLEPTLLIYPTATCLHKQGSTFNCGCDYHRYGGHNGVDLFALPRWANGRLRKDVRYDGAPVLAGRKL